VCFDQKSTERLSSNNSALVDSLRFPCTEQCVMCVMFTTNLQPALDVIASPAHIHMQCRKPEGSLRARHPELCLRLPTTRKSPQPVPTSLRNLRPTTLRLTTCMASSLHSPGPQRNPRFFSTEKIHNTLLKTSVMYTRIV
jgi:hypothetical protein